ncbi:MAG: DNA replication and repair protein RecF [Candidatus Saccharimonadales bacterium]
MITDLRLQHFRSYTDTSFEFGAQVNIIVGPNASGKTNLLEAILVLARGNSYRVRDNELVQFGKPWCRLDADLDAPEAKRTVKIESEPKPSKTYDLDDKIYHRLSMQHTLPTVLFEPNHLALLHGTPELRRNYLDELLEQTIPSYGSHRRVYRRLLSQRNALLKQPKQPSSEEMFPWNLRLSEMGASLARHRAEVVDMISQTLPGLYAKLSGTKNKVKLVYKPSFPLETYESQMMHKLETHAAIDAQRGFTAYGPHREDFTVFFDGHPSEETASRGETRTVILALKIIELQRLEAIRQQTPLLLLDDVFSELDGARRRALTSYLQSYQTFLTTTDADVVVKHFTETSTVIPLKKDH